MDSCLCKGSVFKVSNYFTRTDLARPGPFRLRKTSVGATLTFEEPASKRGIKSQDTTGQYFFNSDRPEDNKSICCELLHSVEREDEKLTEVIVQQGRLHHSILLLI